MAKTLRLGVFALTHIGEEGPRIPTTHLTISALPSFVYPMTKPRLIVILFSALLLTAIGLIIYGQTRPLARTFHGKLAELLPPAPAGWTRTEHPIADTPEMKQKVGELLSYDDGVFYDYTQGNLRLSVYVAYWQPGKMSSRLVAGHTPDVCWVGAGWQCTERDSVDDVTIDSGRLPEVETRTFKANETTEYVWFWHFVNGKPQSYNTGGLPPWYAVFFDLVERGFQQREEQFFIRLSSPQELDDPSLAKVLDLVLQSQPIILQPPAK